MQCQHFAADVFPKQVKNYFTSTSFRSILNSCSSNKRAYSSGNSWVKLDPIVTGMKLFAISQCCPIQSTEASYYWHLNSTFYLILPILSNKCKYYRKNASQRKVSPECHGMRSIKSIARIQRDSSKIANLVLVNFHINCWGFVAQHCFTHSSINSLINQLNICNKILGKMLWNLSLVTYKESMVLRLD